MKTSLNLYHASCQPEKLKFSFAQLMMLVIVCVLLAGLTESLLIYRASNMEAKKVDAADELLTSQNELSMLVVELQSKRAPDDKIRTKSQLTEEVLAKQRLLSNLNHIDLGLVVSFSELMLGLSKADIDQVSISQFSIFNGKLNIQGQALHSDSVPLWLTNIQATTELQAVSFSAVDITEQDNVFTFQLSHVGLNKQSKDKK